VVIPGGSLTLAELVRAAGLTPVVNADAAAGLGDSLRLGVLHLERTLPYGGPTAAVIFLGDQPLVRPDVVAALVAAWRSGTAAVVRPRYSEAPGEPGHPLVVDRTLWHLAARLTGESGLGPALAERGIAPLVLDVAGDNPDVDTRRDLTNLEDRTR
jgi:molybdenum cofactor cytidylyltransferase